MISFPIFWTESYLRLHGEKVFVLGVNELSECIKCGPNEIQQFKLSHYLTCIELDQNVTVPAKATFGGVFPAAGEFIYRTIFEGITKLSESLNLKIGFPPAYFYPEVFDLQREVIESMSGIIKIIDVSYHIDVKDWSTNLLSRGNQKKIRQCSEAGAIFKKDDLGSLSNIYSLISKNRLSKGVELSISQDQLENAIRVFPNEYELFSLYNSSILMASAVTIMLTSTVRYVYMWADHIDYRSLSPIAMLCEEIVKDCRTKNIKVLDLGTASLHGELNEGLARFKQNLGAISTQKISYMF